MKDKQFYEMLKLNGKLQELGNDLVDSIEKAYWENVRRFKTPTPHMKSAVEAWKTNIKENYTEIK